jgi:hypothetical protein
MLDKGASSGTGLISDHNVRSARPVRTRLERGNEEEGKDLHGRFQKPKVAGINTQFYDWQQRKFTEYRHSSSTD